MEKLLLHAIKIMKDIFFNVFFGGPSAFKGHIKIKIHVVE
jgi:hypothetical protein